MNERLKMRPEIPNVTQLENMTSEERFQSETLRPILKLQNDLLARFIADYFVKSKVEFQRLTVKKQNDAITSCLQSNQSLKNKIIGMIIGQFTTDEFERYAEFTGNLNKRIHQMAAERLRDQKVLISSCMEEK